MRKEMDGNRVKWDEPEPIDPNDNPFGEAPGLNFDMTGFKNKKPKMAQGQVSVPPSSNIGSSMDDLDEKKRKKRLNQIA